MGGRELSASERSCSLIERLLLTAQWGMQRWSRYTLYIKVTVMLPYAAEVQALTAVGDLPVRL